jgi:hypothetical protein
LFRRQIGEPYLKIAFLPLLKLHSLADIKGCSNLIAAIESGLPEPDPLDNIQTTISLFRVLVCNFSARCEDVLLK